MKTTHVALLGAIAAGWLALAVPQAAAGPASRQFIIQSARHDACTATLRMEVANLGPESPTVFLGAHGAPLSLVASSATHLVVSVPPSLGPGSYRLTVIVGKAPNEYDEAWITLGGACTG